jgi:hypothetical protein
VTELHTPRAELVVSYKGVERSMVNANLLDRQLCWENLATIKELHWQRFWVHDIMENTDHPDTLRAFDAVCTDIEFALQDAWGFDRDQNRHKFWYRPKCKCPNMDNNDNYPVGHYLISGDCPLHG